MKRALVIGAAPVGGTSELVAELAPSCDVVIGVDGGASVAAAAGVSIDVAIGDFDSLPAGALDELRASHVETVAFPAEKDESDLDLALAHARGRGVREVIVTAAFSSRLDHTLAAVGSLARFRDLWPRLEEPRMRGWLLAEDARRELTVHAAGSTLSVMAVGGTATVSVGGVRWPLDRAVLEPLSSYGLSNKALAADSTVEVHAGAVLVTLIGEAEV